MVSENYKPEMRGKVRGSQIVISKQGLEALDIEDMAERSILERSYEGGSICPPMYFFQDNADVRRILGVEETKP